MVKSDKDILMEISEYCHRIGISIKRYGGYETFLTDNDYFDSVSKKTEQIGELAKQLSDSFIEQTKDEIPWSQIKGMRNIFAHDYGNMDEDQVWQTINEDVPKLHKFCEVQLSLINQHNHYFDKGTEEGLKVLKNSGIDVSAIEQKVTGEEVAHFQSTPKSNERS